MANWFVDSGLGTGNNDGTTFDDAWQSKETALESAGYTPGDVIWDRRTKETGFTSDIALADDGSPSSPIKYIGCPRAEEGSGSGTWANGSTEINDVSGLEMKTERHVGRNVKQDTDGKWYVITYIPFVRGITYAFVDSDPDTITDSANLFVKRGFKAGDKIRVTGSTSNDGTYTVAGVVAGTLTLDGGDSLTAEAAGDSVTIQVYDRFIIDREYAGSNTGDFTIEADEDYDLFNGSETFTADDGTDIITTGSAHPWDTGDSVMLTTTDTLPAGLAVSTWYYVIYLSSTTMYLASSYANALAGTKIDITDTGAGTHTMQTLVDGTITKANWNADADDLSCIDFEGNSYGVVFSSDTYYVLKNLDIRDSDDTFGGLYFATTNRRILIKNLFMTTTTLKNVIGLRDVTFLYLENVILDGLCITATAQQCIYSTNGFLSIKNSALYGSGDYGIANYRQKILLENVNIGVEVENGDDDIYIGNTGSIIGHDVKLGGTNGYIAHDETPWVLNLGNFQKILGNNITYFQGGSLGANGGYKTVDVGDANAPSVASTSGSTTNLMAIYPNVSGYEYIEEWAVSLFTHYFDATTDSKTYTYYLQNNMGVTLNSQTAKDDIWLVAEYVDDYDDTSEYHYTTKDSTETSIAARADDTDWDSLSVAAVQPAVASIVRITCYISKYVASGQIYIDPKPTIT